MFSAFVALAPQSAATYGYVQGDADDNFVVSIGDIVLTRLFIAGIETRRNINIKAADVHKDDEINYKDVLAMRENLAGLVTFEENNPDKAYKVDAVSIGNRNISRYTIVLPNDADPCVEKAARILSDKIKDACGIRLNISPNDKSVKGCRINFIHDNEDIYELGADGFRIEVEDNGDMSIYCGTTGHQRGAHYAVYHILEEFVGYRFLTADDYGDEDGVDANGKTIYKTGDIVYLYESENAVIPAGYAESFVPQITYRAISQKGLSGTNFLALHINDTEAATRAENGWRVGTLYIHAHSYAYQMAGKEYAYNNEYINANGFHNTQPCLSDEETYAKIIDYNTWLIEDRKTWGSGQHFGTHYTQVSCSPNDNTDFCLCSKCTKVYEEEGSISGTVFRLANRVAEYMDTNYPGVETYTIAYWDARRPPKYTRPRDSVCVCYCIGGCNNHPYDHTELCEQCGGNKVLNQVYWNGEAPSSNVDDIAYYLEWTELTNNIQIWYYSCNYTYFLAPAPNIFNVYNDIKYLASTGTSGIYFEGSSDARYCFEYLRGYLATRMMWDPFMSEEEFNDLLNEFLWICYGDGWQYIREYLEMANYGSDLLGCWTNNHDRPWEMNNEAYFKENYKYMATLFDTAYELAGTEAQKIRVSNCRMQCDFLGLSATYDRDYAAKGVDPETKAEFIKRYQTFYDYVEENNVQIMDVGYSGPHGCDNFPSSRDVIIKPMEWLWAGCDGHWHFINGHWQ